LVQPGVNEALWRAGRARVMARRLEGAARRLEVFVRRVFVVFFARHRDFRRIRWARAKLAKALT
jgi:hypothetical protein